MDLTLTTQQQQIVDSLHSLLQRHAGPDRAKALLANEAYDHELDARLEEGGFLDMILEDETGPVETTLAAMEIARSVGTVGYGARAIVAPKLLGERAAGPVALARLPTDFPVRFAADAKLILIDAGAEAQALEVAPGDVQPASNDHLGWPMGRLKPAALGKAKGLGPGSGAALRRWWRLALAAETVGTMQGALALTLEYVKNRRQFGRPIGQFQALQHRLAELTVIVEGARWLALEAGFREAAPLAAATAAGRAAGAASLVARECHQMHGAIGFTRDYQLHLWSVRLGPLAVELGGAPAHRRDAARLRFVAQETAA
ncbi:MAG: hypothetical protein JO127_06670 [Caulobacteraceae bacterium]|nr:hypothetical protein [Caulobacteraceae bacterium]